MLNDTMSMITVINQCKWFTLIFYQSSFYLHCDFFHQLGLHLHCNENKESHIDCRCYYIRLMYGCPYANGCLLAYGCPYASHCLKLTHWWIFVFKAANGRPTVRLSNFRFLYLLIEEIRQNY